MLETHLAHEIAFDGLVVEWRGPASFYFVSVAEGSAGALRAEAKRVSYGWGCVPVTATIDETRIHHLADPAERYLISCH